MSTRGINCITPENLILITCPLSGRGTENNNEFELCDKWGQFNRGLTSLDKGPNKAACGSVSLLAYQK